MPEMRAWCLLLRNRPGASFLQKYYLFDYKRKEPTSANREMLYLFSPSTRAQIFKHSQPASVLKTRQCFGGLHALTSGIPGHWTLPGRKLLASTTRIEADCCCRGSSTCSRCRPLFHLEYYFFFLVVHRTRLRSSRIQLEALFCDAPGSQPEPVKS